MKFGTHKLETIDYLHAKFQHHTTTLTLDFEIGIWVGRTPLEVTGASRYRLFGHTIVNRSQFKHKWYSFASLRVKRHPWWPLMGKNTI